MLDWQKIKAAALKARYTENPTDAELGGDSEAKKGGFAMDLTQYLEKAGPFIGPRGGKWADAKHTIPWGEEKKKEAQPTIAAKEGRPQAFREMASAEDLYHRFAARLPSPAAQAVRFEQVSDGGAANIKRVMSAAPGITQDDAREVVEIAVSLAQDAGDLSSLLQDAHDAHRDGDDALARQYLEAADSKERDMLRLYQGGRRDPPLASMDQKSAQKSGYGTNSLEQYLEKAMPTCEPKQDQGHGEASANGADLDQAGKMTGSGDSESGFTSPGLEGAKPEKKAKLSDDDEEVEGTPKPHRKPIEAKKALDDMRRPYTPNTRREEVAMANAAVARRMADTQDVVVGVGVPASVIEPQPLAKASVSRYGDLGSRTNATDLAVERFLGGDQFYTGGPPTLGVQPSPLRKSRGCSSCGGSIPMALHGCPHCGSGVAAQIFTRGEDVVIKSTEGEYGPMLLRTEPDVKIG